MALFIYFRGSWTYRFANFMDGTYIDFEKKINYWIIIDVGQILETDKRNMVVPELAARYDLKCVIGYRASYRL